MRSTARRRSRDIPTPSPSRIHHRAPATPRREPPRRFLHPCPRGDQLPLRAQPRRSARQHAITLEVDTYGNVLKEARHRLRPHTSGRARCHGDVDQDKQTQTLDHLYREPLHQSDRRCCRTRLLTARRDLRDPHLRADRLHADRRRRAVSARRVCAAQSQWPDARLRIPRSTTNVAAHQRQTAPPDRACPHALPPATI